MANSRERLALVLYTLIAALFIGLLIAEYRRAAKAHAAAHSSVEQRSATWNIYAVSTQGVSRGSEI